MIDWQQMKSPADILRDAELARRQGMTAWKAAFRRALSLMPVEGFEHGLDMVDQRIAEFPRYHRLRLAWENVAQFQRAHPDIEAFGRSLGITDAQLDRLFQIAMAIEAGATDDDIAAIISA